MKNCVVITELSKKVAVEGVNYDLESICLIASGLSTLKSRIPSLDLQSLLPALGRRIGALSLQLEARHVASLVYSFAKVCVE